jgi:hypothetical protein
MTRTIFRSILASLILVGAFLSFPERAFLSSPHQTASLRAHTQMFPLFMPLATILTVDRMDDTSAATACTAAPNDCSLRGAIIVSNGNIGADPVTIDLQPTTTYNLTLTNAVQDNLCFTGDLDISADAHPVAINGNGSTVNAAGLTSGTSHDRAFHIVSGTNMVTFADLTIAGGQATDDGTNGANTNPLVQGTNRFGGGILSSGRSLTLINVTIQSCQALGKGDDIVNEHRTLDAFGGGLASRGLTANIVITNSTFTNNAAIGGNGGNFNNGGGSNASGGSIYFEGGTLSIEGSRIENSNATGGNGGNGPGNQQNGGMGGITNGGGAYIAGGTATINNSTFKNCSANGGNSGTGQNGTNAGADSNGGGLYSAGNVTVTNSTFALNSATGGDSGDSFGVDHFGAHESGNGGNARGGAILADAGTLVINTATLAGNSAHGGDGGNGGQTNGSAGMHGAGGLAYGGAITNANAATINIKHGTISLNSAQAGNTGVNQGGANRPPRLVAEGAGGGIRVGPGSVTLENTIIAGNTAANGLGDTSGAPIPGPNVDGAVTSNGHNLLGIATEATGFTGGGDQTGTNPMLGPLANNGGPTETMELLPGSAATDSGVAAGATLDQRGLARTVDDPGAANAATSDGTDIGAYERDVACVLECPTDVSVANDPAVCGAVVNYAMPSGDGCGTVTCDHPSGSFFAVGETTVVCTSSAGPTCDFKVTVSDEEAPVITTNGQTITLWPPNHSYQTIVLTDVVTSAVDNCDTSVGLGSVTIAKVTSDEIENGNGDGNTLNDIVIAANCKSVQLRAERMGTGNGRVYTITFQVADAAGHISTATAKVTVPKSQNGAAAVDDGPHYTVLGGCP